MQRHRVIRSGGGFHQLPFAGAREAVRRFAVAIAEPRKTDGHAAANRPVRREITFAAQEQQRRPATFLKAGDVRAVQINLRRAQTRADIDLWQSAVAARDGNASGNFVFPQEAGYIGVFHRAGKTYHAPLAGAVIFVRDKQEKRGRFAGAGTRATRATSDKTHATSPGADHFTPLAFLDREMFRIQLAPPVRVSNFVNSVNSVGRNESLSQCFFELVSGVVMF